MTRWASTMVRMSEPTCFACPQPATGATRAQADGHACEVDTCDEHRDAERWTERTRALLRALRGAWARSLRR